MRPDAESYVRDLASSPVPPVPLAAIHKRAILAENQRRFSALAVALLLAVISTASLAVFEAPIGGAASAKHVSSSLIPSPVASTIPRVMEQTAFPVPIPAPSPIVT